MTLDECPFCGVRPLLHPENPSLQGDSWAMIKCFNKDCPVDVSITIYSPSDAIEKARQAWNKRAKQHESQALRE